MVVRQLSLFRLNHRIREQARPHWNGCVLEILGGGEDAIASRLTPTIGLCAFS